MINSDAFFKSLTRDWFLNKTGLLSKMTEKSILNLMFQNNLGIQVF
jgi:hypothetical protein